MVGAERIGEYCWSLEHLLNRIIDGTVPRTPALMNYLSRAIPPVIELLEELEIGLPPPSDIRTLMAEANAYGSMEPVAVPEDSSEQIENTEAPVFSESQVALEQATRGPSGLVLPALPPLLTGAGPSIDPVLLDILSREVGMHLGVIRAFLAKGAEVSSQPVPEAIFRACHTLHGSLTMAGVARAVAVAAPLNDLIAVLYEARLPRTGSC